MDEGASDVVASDAARRGFRVSEQITCTTHCAPPCGAFQAESFSQSEQHVQAVLAAVQEPHKSTLLWLLDTLVSCLYCAPLAVVALSAPRVGRRFGTGDSRPAVCLQATCASEEASNRMGPKNLGVVFGPNLVDPPDMACPTPHASNQTLAPVVLPRTNSSCCVPFFLCLQAALAGDMLAAMRAMERPNAMTEALVRWRMGQLGA